MVNKKSTFLLTLSILLILVITACGNNSTPSPEEESEAMNEEEPEATNEEDSDEEVVLKLGHITNEDHPIHDWAVKFKEVVEEESDGNLNIDIYPNSQLGADSDMAAGLETGTVDVAMLGVSFYSYLPQWQIMEYPFLFRDREHYWAVQDGEMVEQLKQDSLDEGFKLLGFAEFGARHMTNSKQPIETPEDLKGMKMRVPGGDIYVNMMEALGAEAVSVDFNELYLALQQNVVDGQENPLSSIYSANYFETQEYLSLTGHIYTVNWPVMNSDRFSELTEQQQEIIENAGRQVTEHIRSEIEKNENELLENLKQEGMKVNEVDISSFEFVTDEVAERLKEEVSLELVDEIRNQ